MPKINEHMNKAGYFTPGQLIAQHPEILEQTGWTIGEINTLVKMGVLNGRQLSKITYVQKSDFLLLFDYINSRRQLYQSY